MRVSEFVLMNTRTTIESRSIKYYGIFIIFFTINRLGSLPWSILYFNARAFFYSMLSFVIILAFQVRILPMDKKLCFFDSNTKNDNFLFILVEHGRL